MIDAELRETEGTQPDDREDDPAYEQHLARRLHKARLPASLRLEPTDRPPTRRPGARRGGAGRSVEPARGEQLSLASTSLESPGTERLSRLSSDWF